MVHSSKPFFRKGAGLGFNNARLICELVSQFSEVQEQFALEDSLTVCNKKRSGQTNLILLDLVAIVHYY